MDNSSLNKMRKKWLAVLSIPFIILLLLCVTGLLILGFNDTFRNQKRIGDTGFYLQIMDAGYVQYSVVRKNTRFQDGPVINWREGDVAKVYWNDGYLLYKSVDNYQINYNIIEYDNYQGFFSLFVTNDSLAFYHRLDSLGIIPETMRITQWGDKYLKNSSWEKYDTSKKDL